MEIPTSPYKIPKNPYERELGGIDPVMYKPIPPSLQSIWPLLKAIYQRTEPEPVKTAPEPPGDYMTTNEVAVYIKRSPNTIRRLCRENDIPFIVLPGEGGDRIFSKEMVRKWLAARAVNVPEP